MEWFLRLLMGCGALQGGTVAEREEKFSSSPPLSRSTHAVGGRKERLSLNFKARIGFSGCDKPNKRVADLLGPLWSLVLVSHGRERGEKRPPALSLGFI